jgi:ribonuclease HII
VQKAESDLTSLFCEAYRLFLHRGLEEILASGGHPLVAGVDEAGRGCLAGPVVAAAVLIDARAPNLVPGVDDSKKVSALRRTALAQAVRKSAVASAWIAVSPRTIERINILQATRLAMRRAVEGLAHAPDVVVVDAVSIELSDSSIPCVPVVRADAWCYAVACASLIAKTERDRLMQSFHHEYPDYGFSRNKGYGAPEHRRALDELGPSPIHRLTFRSVVPRREPRLGADPTRARRARRLPVDVSRQHQLEGAC